jgi:hypothetical protein
MQRRDVREIATEIGVAPLIERYDAIGGVLDYVFLELVEPTERLHREAALRGMAVIDDRLAQWASSRATPEVPVEKFFRVHWDESKLSGQQVSLPTFWGTDDVEPKPLGGGAYSIPNVDGYKTAFFHPPYGLGAEANERAELYTGINGYVLGDDPDRAEIFSWSTDWSNYFDAGHEWWGAFYWTIRPADKSYVVVIGASSTD